MSIRWRALLTGVGAAEESRVRNASLVTPPFLHAAPVLKIPPVVLVLPAFLIERAIGGTFHLGADVCPPLSPRGSEGNAEQTN